MVFATAIVMICGLAALTAFEDTLTSINLAVMEATTSESCDHRCVVITVLILTDGSGFPASSLQK